MFKMLTCKNAILCLCMPLAASCALESATPSDEPVTAEEESSLTGGGAISMGGGAITAITCSGPALTNSYSDGSRKTGAVKVSCTGTVSRIRVFGSLSIKGVVKDSEDVTCTNATSCTMPGMSAVANLTDQWSSQYSFNYSL